MPLDWLQRFFQRFVEQSIKQAVAGVVACGADRRFAECLRRESRPCFMLLVNVGPDLPSIHNCSFKLL